jgi:hypothetical protein
MIQAQTSRTPPSRASSQTRGPQQWKPAKFATQSRADGSKDENAELSVQIEQHRNVEYRDWHIVKNGAKRFAHWPKLRDAPGRTGASVGERPSPQTIALPGNIERCPKDGLHRAKRPSEFADDQTV